MTRVKICGITSTTDAQDAVKCGATALGFIFYKKSPRSVGAFKAKKIITSLPPLVTPVGVFVDQKEGAVRDILKFSGIRTIQFHGEESPAYCRRFAKQYTVIKAFRVGAELDPKLLKSYKDDVHAFLFDTYAEDQAGGTGKTFNWALAKRAKNAGLPIILSGGLHYNNVIEAIETVRPYAVDVSSGVEVQDQPGKKLERSMRLFCEKAML
ncbi:MAG: phosphoribosylanthranilate isomerase [Candidatus Omnitrophota bacterium]